MELTTTSPLIDTHCHISFDNFHSDIDSVTERWRINGIRNLIHACVEPSEIPTIKNLAHQLPELYYSVGVHPLDTKSWFENTFDLLYNAARDDKKVVAIGEIGLDLFRDKNLCEQKIMLKKQIYLSEKLNLPIIVHCREATSEMLKCLEELASDGIIPRGVMHCWGGSKEEMFKFIDLGFYISFSGTVTFKKAFDIHESAKCVPDDLYVIETDSPFLAPVPNRGKRNEPSFVRYVALKISELKSQSFHKVAENSTINAKKLFNLP